MRRIIVADTREGIATLLKVLGDDAHMIPATSLTEALSKVDEGADLVLCGIHFEQSRMFDFLRMAKARPATRALPFLCYRDMSSELSATVLEGLSIACKALGAEEFIDLYELRRKHGAARADEMFKCAVLGRLRGQERGNTAAC